jgi:hypothetical protein
VINAATAGAAASAAAATHLVIGARNHLQIVRAIVMVLSAQMGHHRVHLQRRQVLHPVQLQVAATKQLWNAMEP